MLPPNLVVLAPAVFVAALAAWLAGTAVEAWLTTLLRFSAGLAIALGVIGVVSIVSIMVRDEAGPVDIESLLLRLGGVTFAAPRVLVDDLDQRTNAVQSVTNHLRRLAP